MTFTDSEPLGPRPEHTTQKIDRTWAETALLTRFHPTIENERLRPAAQATRHLN